MTLQEMITRAEILFEAIDSDNVMGFTDVEWGQIFTQAQHDIVLSILKDGLTRNSFNSRALDAITETDNIAGNFTLTGSSPKFTLTMTDDVWWILRVTAEVTAGGSSYSDILVDGITYDEYHPNKNNPFKKPDRTDRYWRYPQDGKMIIITDTITSLDEVDVDYARLPAAISSSGEASELHESVHNLIVKRGAQIAHKSAEDEKGYQMQVIENQSPRIP